ncbi:hypothetical protein JCM10207_005252 [Rhodosporidiobolus poonsookiae]
MASRSNTPTLSTGPVRKPGAPSRTPSAAATKPSAASSSAPSPSPAPPRAPSAPLPDLATLLNLPIRLTLVATGDLPQRDIEGALFTYDSSFAVLSSPSSAPPSLSASTASSTSRRSFTFIKTSQIKSVTVLSPTPDPSLPPLSAPLPPAPSSTSADISARVDKAVAEDRKARARVGQGVSAEAQAVFDGLAKTLPVRWHGKQIVVMDEILIDEPYGVENVKAGKGAQDRLERIRRVLTGIRARLDSTTPQA